MILCAGAPGSGAQAVSIPARPLGTTDASSPAIFTRIENIRHLSDGRVLVNDASKRQIVLLDATLANPVVVIDSAGGKDNSYGRTSGGLIPFRGDSTLFVDGTALVFLVIDPSGKIARVTPLPPRVTIPSYLTSSITYGHPGVSSAFGLVFRLPGRTPVILRTAAPGQPPPAPFRYPDSAFVVGMNLSTRTLDTILGFPTGTSRLVASTSAEMLDDLFSGASVFPTINDWALMSDGSIAILRGGEYRVDFYGADRSRLASPRLPYDWQRLTDDDRVRLADSINAVRKRSHEASLARRAADSVALANGTAPAGRAGRVGSTITTVIDGEIVRRTGLPAPPRPQPLIKASDLPDYMPAVQRLTPYFLADADNNVWIRPKPVTRVAGSTVYDIVNRKGELIDRILIPTGKTIAGFGPGIVYLIGRDGGAAKLERARFK